MGKVKRPMVPVAHSPSPWVAWYDKNEGGLIYQERTPLFLPAGVSRRRPSTGILDVLLNRETGADTNNFVLQMFP